MRKTHARLDQTHIALLPNWQGGETVEIVGTGLTGKILGPYDTIGYVWNVVLANGQITMAPANQLRIVQAEGPC